MSSEKLNIIETFEDQDKFVNAVFSGLYKFLLFAGDIRSGKTIICLVVLVVLCKVYPGSRWCVVRHDRPTILRNTIPTFFKYCLPVNFLDDYNKSELIVRFKNKSEIFFMSEAFTDDPELNRFKGLEVNGFVLEQIEELRKATFSMCVQRAGQWKVDPMPPTLILANSNPTNNWVKYDWYDKFMNGELKPPWYFQEADINKNPYITKQYIQTLKETLPPELFERFLERRWEAVDDINQLTPWDIIYKCKCKVKTTSNKKYLGVDVAREGRDPSVWTIIEDCNINEIIRIDKTKITEVTEKTVNIMAQHKINAEDVCVDAVGLGAGVVDELELKGFYVISHVGGGGCDQELSGTNFTFANVRAWSHWLASQQMKDGKIGNFVDTTLKSDAGAIKYVIKNDKNIYIESKEEFKKRAGRSSDYWDSFVYAVWAKMQDSVSPSPGMLVV